MREIRIPAPTIIGSRGSSISRRQFLGRSAQLAAGASLSLGVLSTFGCGSGTSGVGDVKWADLARRISGPVILPGDPGYLKFSLPDNLRYAAILPAGIARCKIAEDVAQSILWSRENDVALITRSGGHSYAGYSSTTGLMIDMPLINQVEYDSTSGIVTIGGGALNSDLYPVLQSAGVAITHGRCTTVGAAGFLLGGGIGFNMRAHGIGSDAITATEIVTANGDILSADSTDNSDLLWACQGGAGGNFGINTSFSVQTFPVPESLTVYKIRWTADIDDLLPALIAALDNAPAGLGCRVRLNAVTPAQLASGKDVSVDLLGQLVGTPMELAAILAPAYHVAQPAISEIEVMTYWDAQINFLGESGEPGRYQERSRFYPVFGADPIATAIRWSRKWPGTSGAANMKLFQTGDVMNTIAPDATAFVHRDSSWLMSIALTWARTDSSGVIAENREWQNGFYHAMLPYTDGGAFQNFPDPSLVDWKDAYYGSNLSRLEQIKSAVDPHRVFNFPQAIPPAPAATSTQPSASISMHSGRTNVIDAIDEQAAL